MAKAEAFILLFLLIRIPSWLDGKEQTKRGN